MNWNDLFTSASKPLLDAVAATVAALAVQAIRLLGHYIGLIRNRYAREIIAEEVNAIEQRVGDVLDNPAKKAAVLAAAKRRLPGWPPAVLDTMIEAAVLAMKVLSPFTLADAVLPSAVTTTTTSLGPASPTGTAGLVTVSRPGPPKPSDTGSIKKPS